MADANQTFARVYFFDVNRLLETVLLPANDFDGLMTVVEQNLPSGYDAVDSYWYVEEQQKMLDGIFHVVGQPKTTNQLPTTPFHDLSSPASYKMGVRVICTA